MPHPIPDWDLPRVLIQFIANRQISGDSPTLQETCRRIGCGIRYTLRILDNNKVEFEIIPPGNYYKNKIILTGIPDRLADMYGILKEQVLEKVPELLVGAAQEVDVVKLRKNKKRQEEQKKLRYFLVENGG